MSSHKTKNKGDFAVAKVILDLTEKDYTIFVPVITEHLPFDLIAYKDNKCIRIQCKYRNNGAVSCANSWFSTKTGRHRRVYSSTDFDYYALYLPQIDKIVYPSILFAGKTIRQTIPKNGNSYWWWEDFLQFTDIAEKRIRIPKKPPRKKRAKVTKLPKSKYNPADRRKVERPSKEELFKLVWEMPTIKLAEKFGVSDKAIGKWCKSYGIDKPPRGYWRKLQTNNL